MLFFQITIIKSDFRYFTYITYVSNWSGTALVLQGIASTAIEAIQANLQCRLQAIKLYFNEYLVLFTDQIFKTSLQQKAQPSIYFKIPDEFFQTLVR